MANLINGYGKGLKIDRGTPHAGWHLHQGDTRGTYTKGNKWSYNETSLGSEDRHLCNGFGKCAGSSKTNVLANNGTLKWDKMGWIQLKQWVYSNDESQRFYFLDSLTHPGFYVIKDEFGKCIGVPENTDRNEAELWACYCNSSDVGQRWQWHYLDDKIKGANLINGLGKCLNSGDNPDNYDVEASNYLYQWNCNKTVDTMLWSWNQSNFGSGDRHLCDGDVFCVTTPENGNWSYILHAYYPIGMESQKFSFFDSPTYPGFYVVKNDFGKCLSVKGNTNKTGARIMADDCKPSEAGQNWKWLN